MDVPNDIERDAFDECMDISEIGAILGELGLVPLFGGVMYDDNVGDIIDEPAYNHAYEPPTIDEIIDEYMQSDEFAWEVEKIRDYSSDLVFRKMTKK
jgi:hypothetical protein